MYGTEIRNLFLQIITYQFLLELCFRLTSDVLVRTVFKYTFLYGSGGKAYAGSMAAAQEHRRSLNNANMLKNINVLR